jgi:hypothetical protein
MSDALSLPPQAPSTSADYRAGWLADHLVPPEPAIPPLLWLGDVIREARS